MPVGLNRTSASPYNVFSTEQGRRLAVIGAGGKSFLIQRLVDRHTDRRDPVVVTTTTRMYRCQTSGPLYQRLSASLLQDPPPVFTLARPVENNGTYDGSSTEPEHGGPDTHHPPSEAKVQAPEPSEINRLLIRSKHRVLIEADGAKQRLLKIHRSYEPVIPEAVDAVVTVLNLDVLGQPAGPDLIHPYELWTEHFSPEEPIRVPTLEALLEFDPGYEVAGHTESWLCLITSGTGEKMDPKLAAFGASFWDRYARVGLFASEGFWVLERNP